MPRKPAPPCRDCGEKSRRLGFCNRHALQWMRAHEQDRCTYCSTQTADPTGGARRGRVWTLTDGSRVVSCRSCLPVFLEERRPAVLEALAAAITADDHGRWITQEGKRNASGYGLIFIPGTRQRAYAHHVAYALFHGGWTAEQQVHHRTQLRPEISPWTLQAVAIAEHEKLKEQPPIVEPVKVARQELLEEFAAQYSLPLPGIQPATEDLPKPEPKRRTTMFKLFGDSHPTLTEPEPITGPAPKSKTSMRALFAAAAAQSVIEELPAPEPEQMTGPAPKRKRARFRAVGTEYATSTSLKESTVDNVTPIDQYRQPQQPQLQSGPPMLPAGAQYTRPTNQDIFRALDVLNRQKGERIREQLRYGLTGTR